MPPSSCQDLKRDWRWISSHSMPTLSRGATEHAQVRCVFGPAARECAAPRTATADPRPRTGGAASRPRCAPSRPRYHVRGHGPRVRCTRGRAPNNSIWEAGWVLTDSELCSRTTHRCLRLPAAHPRCLGKASAACSGRGRASKGVTQLTVSAGAAGPTARRISSVLSGGWSRIWRWATSCIGWQKVASQQTAPTSATSIGARL